MAFFNYNQVDAWSNCLDKAMIKSGNPFKLAALFHRHAGERERDFSTAKAIEAEIERLKKENVKALERIRLEYYYTTSLPTQFCHQMQKMV